MEPENDGLEDDFPFTIGWFWGSMLIFWGVVSNAMYKPWNGHLEGEQPYLGDEY